ncbi:MAG TPA: hypothetical protein VMA30_05325 [Xanthobacteraceae bacterium]|nr:hypothetical protein [Xanthobacteraceae bacterium]
MGLNPMALDVVMSLIAISIPALIFVGCVMTRKSKTAAEPGVIAPHFELDRAA